ncbi:MAG: aminopeptidase N [Propionibacteriaceae bacterium]|jgi:aminopeptidase N|nr:aminopeptidase N [Propionibacteriaceae bacterium]
MNLTRQEAEARATLIAVDQYQVELDLTSPGPTFRSICQVSFDCRQVGASSFIDLIADRVDAVILNGQRLDPATVFADHRVQLPDLQAHNELLISADMAWSHTGEGLHRFTDPIDGQTYCYSQFEVADARRVFANFEQPDLKAQFHFQVTAPADWTVWSNQPVDGEPESIAPADSASTSDTATPAAGTAVAATPARRWQFRPTPVMSTYLTAIVAGPYQAWQDHYQSVDGRIIPLSILVRPTMAEFLDSAELFDITRRGFEFYEQAFGLPFPYEKYDQAFVPEYNAGAMENIGLVTLTEVYVFRSKPTQAAVTRRAITVLHEQAHMWFGDLVTMRWWNDLWLNESFAEFVSHLAAAANTRWTEAWTTFLASEKSWALKQDQLPSTHPIVAPIRDLADVEVNFDGITYAKGAAVLRQLVAWVGQDNFLRGVSAYLRRHAWGNATLADLLTELTAASGRDLTAWSQHWLEEAGVTILSPEIRLATVDGSEDATNSAVTENDSQTTSTAAFQTDSQATSGTVQNDSPATIGQPIDQLTIHQTVPPIYAETAADLGLPAVTPSLRPARLAVAGYYRQPQGLTRGWQCEVDITGPTTVVPAAQGQAKPDLLLVNDGDLAYAKLRLDPVSLETALTDVAQLHDPLARALVWASLWDATRDGELPARRYVEAVVGPDLATNPATLPAAPIAQETDPTTVQTLLLQARTCLAYYVPAPERQTLSDQTATRLLALAQSAPPGSDGQLQLTRAFLALAQTPAATDVLLALWEGHEAIPGLVVDTDLRWDVVTSLVAQGRLDDAAIAAELARDPSTRGHESAARARAARPTVAAKQAAWQAVLSDQTISNATQRALIAGFNQVGDRDLLTPFVEPYFAALTEVWRTRTREMATNVVEGFYPALSLNQVDVVATTDRWLTDQADASPALRRLVIEGRAAVRRALRAQRQA